MFPVEPKPRIIFHSKSEAGDQRVVERTRIGKKLHPAEAINSKSQSLGSKVSRRILLQKRPRRESSHKKRKGNKIAFQPLGKMGP